MVDPWIIAFLLILLSFVDRTYGTPVVYIATRWLRWLLVSALFAALCVSFELSYKPFTLLWLVGFMGWFLVETIYTWIGVRVLSRIDAPLIPLFRDNPRADEWPNHPDFIILRDELRKTGFNKRQSLKAELYQGLEIRSTVFENESDKVRLQVLFIPISSRRFSTYYVFYSVTKSGPLFITDNVQMPFGGYYPDNWHMKRRPLISSWKKLLEKHNSYIQESGEVLTLCEDEPLVDINNRQRELERFNVDIGILFPTTMHEEYGKITWEGRYRLWKEVWLQKYLGACD